MDRYAEFLYQALEIDTLAKQLAQDRHPWADNLPAQAKTLLDGLRHGDMKRWLAPIKELPVLQNIDIELAQPLDACDGIDIAVGQPVAGVDDEVEVRRDVPALG